MRVLLQTGLCIAVFLTCTNWGFLAHRTIHQLAVYELPQPLQQLFYRHLDSIVRNAVRPDLRRSEDRTEGPKHYINLELFGPDAVHRMPLLWEEATAVYSRDSLLKYGHVPYYIMMMKDKLTQAFRQGLADSVLFYATDMAHYIADAHVPLHTTSNYDGQLTGQRGLHSVWESLIPEMELAGYTLSSRHRARYLQEPQKAIWDAVRHAHSLVPDLLEKERQASTGFTDATKFRVQVRNGRESKIYTKEFAKAYSRLLGSTVNDQLIRSADLIADFWYTCWVDAGRPDVSKWVAPAWGKSDKVALKKELKAFRKNRLVSRKLLRSLEVD
jgi:S1/P1 Nuclease.